jgi:putative NADPH-quinone reductase
MPHTLVIHAHPNPQRSLITRDLKAVFDAAPDTQVRSLYELYPDFDIDVATEQQALSRAELVVWLAPVHWYSVPALMKHWIDQVLAHGWAYGHDRHALAGKSAWWVASAGGGAADYQAGGAHHRPFDDYVAPMEGVARYCRMHWLPPFVVHGGHAASGDQRSATCGRLQAQFDGHRARPPATATPPEVNA